MWRWRESEREGMRSKINFRCWFYGRAEAEREREANKKDEWRRIYEGSSLLSLSPSAVSELIKREREPPLCLITKRTSTMRN
jgi:hypothetical protein